MNSVPATAIQQEHEATGAYSLSLDRERYERYQALVRRMAIKLARRLPSQIKMEDLIGAGWIGMVEALRRRQGIPTETQFENYAAHRVRGSILDYLRSLDPMTRKMRGASRQITGAIKAFTARVGRSPAEEEIARELEMDLDGYRVLLHQVAQADPTRVELTDGSSPRSASDAAPDIMAQRYELADRIAAAVERIPGRMQVILSLYYQEERSFREIAEVLALTEARICQLHGEAIHLIRAYLDTGTDGQGAEAKERR